MSEIIKWSETNVGKYSMFNIELGGIKTEISCDSENSEKLISLLKELEHGHATMNEENEKLKQQIKTSVLLSEAEKNTLALMRSQIDELLGAEVVEPIPSNEHHYSIKPVGGYEFVNIIRACKILGFTRKNVNEYFHIDAYVFLKQYGLRFDDLCGPTDTFYNKFFNTGMKSRSKAKKDYNYIKKNDNLFLKRSEETLNDLADKHSISVQSLWAYCITQSRDFEIEDCNGNIQKFIFDLEPQSDKAINAHRLIEARGGIPKLKKLRRDGYKQYEIADMWGIKSSSITHYITRKGERWSSWPKH